MRISLLAERRLHSKRLIEKSSVAFHRGEKQFQESKEILVAFREYDKRINKLKEANN